MVRFRKELWTMDALERESKGRCFAHMMLDTTYRPSNQLNTCGKENRIHQFTYRFHRHNGELADSSLLSGHIGVSDAVTVSVEPDLFALSRGFVLELTPHAVVIGVDHDLDVKVIKERLNARPRKTPVHEDDTVVFRIDKDELAGGMGRVRDNLAALFYAGGDSERLRLIVDLDPPMFHSVRSPSACLLASVRASERCQRITASLNLNQRQAVDRVLCARDYSLILGMPGTGKTTMVASLIKVLVEMDRTVLLTSYTHSAVDTILSKLKGADFGVLRLGNIDKVSELYHTMTFVRISVKVHPDAHEFTLAARRRATTIEELERQLMTPPVVATTALSLDQ